MSFRMKQPPTPPKLEKQHMSIYAEYHDWREIGFVALEREIANAIARVTIGSGHNLTPEQILEDKSKIALNFSHEAGEISITYYATDTDQMVAERVADYETKLQQYETWKEKNAKNIAKWNIEEQKRQDDIVRLRKERSDKKKAKQDLINGALSKLTREEREALKKALKATNDK